VSFQAAPKGSGRNGGLFWVDIRLMDNARGSWNLRVADGGGLASLLWRKEDAQWMDFLKWLVHANGRTPFQASQYIPARGRTSSGSR